MLAKRSQPEDRARLVESLASPQASAVEASAAALGKLDAPPSEAEIAAAMMTLRQYCASPTGSGVRKALGDLLTHWSGVTFDIKESKKIDPRVAYEPWFTWFAATYPDSAKKQASSGSIDLTALKEKLGGGRLEKKEGG